MVFCGSHTYTQGMFSRLHIADRPILLVLLLAGGLGLVVSLLFTADDGMERMVETESGDAMFQHDIRRSGFLNTTTPESVTLGWTLEGVNKWTHSAAKSSPVVVNRTVIVGGDTGTVYAVWLNGTVRWMSSTHPSENGIHGTATVQDGTVYIGAYDGAVYAFNGSTGDRLWRTKLGDAIGSSPAYYNGKLYVSVETHEPSGIMVILNASTGNTLWTDHRISDHPHSSVAISPETDVFVVGANDGTLYAWNLTTNTFAWSYQTGDAIKGPILIHADQAVFGSWDHTVYSINLSDGTLDWQYETDGKIMSGAAVNPATGAIYIGSHDTRLHAINVSTGDRLWRFDTDGWITGSITATQNTVLTGSKDNNLYAVNATSGQHRWTYSANGDVTSAPYVTQEGQVLFTDRATTEDAGSLHLLQPR